MLAFERAEKDRREIITRDTSRQAQRLNQDHAFSCERRQRGEEDEQKFPKLKYFYIYFLKAYRRRLHFTECKSALSHKSLATTLFKFIKIWCAFQFRRRKHSDLKPLPIAREQNLNARTYANDFWLSQLFIIKNKHFSPLLCQSPSGMTPSAANISTENVFYGHTFSFSTSISEPVSTPTQKPYILIFFNGSKNFFVFASPLDTCD